MAGSWCRPVLEKMACSYFGKDSSPRWASWFYQQLANPRAVSGKEILYLAYGVRTVVDHGSDKRRVRAALGENVEQMLRFSGPAGCDNRYADGGRNQPGQLEFIAGSHPAGHYPVEADCPPQAFRPPWPTTAHRFPDELWLPFMTIS